jgi:hypothetical protein
MLGTLEYLRGPTIVWPGHIGYLAVEYLVSNAPTGPLSLRTICELVANGVALDEAFARAFGISKQAFYQSFPGYFASLQ